MRTFDAPTGWEITQIEYAPDGRLLAGLGADLPGNRITNPPDPHYFPFRIWDLFSGEKPIDAGGPHYMRSGTNDTACNLFPLWLRETRPGVTVNLDIDPLQTIKIFISPLGINFGKNGHSIMERNRFRSVEVCRTPFGFNATFMCDRVYTAKHYVATFSWAKGETNAMAREFTEAADGYTKVRFGSTPETYVTYYLCDGRMFHNGTRWKFCLGLGSVVHEAVPLGERVVAITKNLLCFLGPETRAASHQYALPHDCKFLAVAPDGLTVVTAGHHQATVWDVE